MSKRLKRFNKDSQEWEFVSAPDNPVVNVVDENTEVKAEKVIVDNVNYTDEDGNPVTLDDTLTAINDDISKLQRNVSWLAEHGGGGGNGGSSTSDSDYAFEIMDPVPTDGKINTNSTTVSVTFRITGGTRGEKCTYIAYYNKYLSSDYKSITVNENETITFDLDTTKSSHTLILYGTDPYGTEITRYILNIQENSVILDSQNQAINVSGAGNIYVNVTSKVLGTVNVLFTNNLNKNKYTYSYQGTTTDKTKVTISLKQSGLVNSLSVGASYQITAQATVVTSDGTTVKSETISFRVNVASSNDISIVFSNLTSVDDIENGYAESPTSVALGYPLSFQFIPYLINYTGSIYYAIKAISPTNVSKLLVGSYYDDDLHTDEVSDYSSNPYGKANEYASISIIMNESFSIADDWKLVVKCWSTDGKVATNEAVFDVVAANDELYGFQYSSRSLDNSDTTVLCRWYEGNMDFTYPTSWVSKVSNYNMVNGTSDESIISPEVTMSIKDSVMGTSGLLQSPNRLRLQNNAHAEIDLEDYKGEVQGMMSNSEQFPISEGFTISLTFMSDDHPYNDRTVFQWGTLSSSGELLQGIKVDLEKAYWTITDTNKKTNTLSVTLSQNVKTTIDFVYDNDLGVAKIFVNGVINSAIEIGNFDSTTYFPNKMYIGCSHIDTTNTNTSYSNVDIYNLYVTTKYLTDEQIVINSKESKLVDRSEDTMTDYKNWKFKNLFDASVSTPSNLLYGSTGYNHNPSYSDLKEVSPIPVILLDQTRGEGRSFTKSVFKNTYNVSTKIRYDGFTMYFYDPSTNREAICNNIWIAIQGTSSTTYGSKNLEIYLSGTTYDGDTEKSQMFQPKDTWLPEREFTLKADVVDSGHINNATLGAWINSCGLMEDNPAMEAFAITSNKPKDTITYSTGKSETYKHAMKNESGTSIDYHETPTIKHTLEGFPVVLLVQFADGESPEYLGIYSFNLGRYSYYNMGLKFLKSFSRRTEDNPTVDPGCPAVINSYEEYPLNSSIAYGSKTIQMNGIFSFEFDAGADENNSAYPTFSQDSINVIKHYGEFKYNGELGNDTAPSDDTPWEKLKTLFSTTSVLNPVSTKYDYTSSGYKDLGVGTYVYDDTAYEKLNEQISVRNAAAYFAIANAGGMVDSLGKNFTLRTWNGNAASDASGENVEYVKWWPCFYDMDTALGLTNDGDETVENTVTIDHYYNKCVYVWTDDDGVEHRTTSYSEVPKQDTGDMIAGVTTAWTASEVGVNDYSVITNYSGSKYGSYNNKLWNIIRDSKMIYTETDKYEEGTQWKNMRDTVLKSHNDFIEYIENRMGSCGEMMYNYDYNYKYLTKFVSSDGVTGYGNITMLHGNRIEYIRNWMKGRISFLDGVFKYTPADSTIDSVYNTTGVITSAGIAASGTTAFIPFTVRSSYPIFVKCNIGQGQSDDETNTFFVPAYTDTKIYLKAWTSQKKLTINNTKYITKLEGLDGIRFAKFETITLPSLSTFSISGSNRLLSSNGQSPISFESNFEGSFVVDGATGIHSFLEDINVSNTSFSTSDSSNQFEVNLNSYCEKLSNLDISNSCVTSLVLPSIPLKSLKVNGSTIPQFVIQNQIFLDTVNFTGCLKLQSIQISQSHGFKYFDIAEMPLLGTFNVENCSGITRISINNCAMLSDISIQSCASLEEIDIEDCTNSQLAISILNCPSLKKITINGVQSEKTIVLPERSQLGNVTYLNLDKCYYQTHLKYGNEEPETYGDGEDMAYVFDLSPFTSLKGENATFKSLNKLTYVRVSNIEDNPFDIDSESFGSNQNIRRIFGHIRIVGSRAFYNFKKFSINGEVAEGSYPDWSYKYTFVPTSEDDKYYTNLSIASSDLTECFMNTSVTYRDMYQILQACNSGVTNVYSMFAGCESIVVDYAHSIDENMFENLTSVVNMNRMFEGCNNFNTILPSVLLRPMITNTGLTEFCRVFPSTVVRNPIEVATSGNQAFFYNSHIKKIESFNPSYTSLLEDGTLDTSASFPLPASTICDGLQDVEEIIDSFSPVMIDTYTDDPYSDEAKYAFRCIYIDTMQDSDTGEWNEKGIFYGLKSLKIIQNSFNNLYITKGGNSDEERAMKIKNVFGLSGNENYPTKINTIINSFSWYIGPSKVEEGGVATLLIGDNMLTNFKTELINFYGNFGGNIEKTVNTDDCELGGFPYKILNGCTKLENVDSLFRGVYVGETEFNFSWDSYGIVATGKYKDITLPTYVGEDVQYNMFDGCTKLKDISNFFEDMKYANVTLTPDGFEGTNIVNMAALFRLTNSALTTENAYIVSDIPYHFLYQGEGKKAITSVEEMFHGQCRIKPYTLDATEISFVDCYIKSTDSDSDNEYEWNVGICDGTDTMRSFIVAQSDYTRLVELYDVIANSGDTSSYSDLLGTNGKPILPLELPEEITEYNDYARTNLDISQFMGTGAYIQDIGGAASDPEEATVYATRNYICPPDFFKYCYNSKSTNIDGCFMYTSYNVDITDEDYRGLYGTIPPTLLEPIRSISSVSRMFEGCRMILPYKFASYEFDTSIGANVLKEKGAAYPTKLFQNMPNLTNANYTFAATRLWGNTEIGEELFNGCSNIARISYMWYLCDWANTATIAWNVFASCGALSDISGLLSYSGPVEMSAALITYSNNPNVTVVGYFMNHANATTGTVPTFWNDFQIPGTTDKTSVYDYCYRTLIDSVNDPNMVAWYNDGNLR